MATNLSVLTLPWSPPNLADFDICDRRYGLNLDIPQCDVAAGRLDIGSESIEYRVTDREGPHTLPNSISYGTWIFAGRFAWSGLIRIVQAVV